MKNGLPSVRLDDQALERRQFGAVAEQRGQHLVGALLAERIEPQLRVVGLAAPLMRVLGAVVHQQQDLARCRSSRRADSAAPGSPRRSSAGPRRSPSAAD